MANRRYEVRFEAQATKQLRKIDPPNLRRILAAARLLEDNPFPPKATQLVGFDGLWRLRVGDYRILYVVDGEVLTVIVVKLGHRRDVYDF